MNLFEPYRTHETPENRLLVVERIANFNREQQQKLLTNLINNYNLEMFDPEVTYHDFYGEHPIERIERLFKVLLDADMEIDESILPYDFKEWMEQHDYYTALLRRLKAIQSYRESAHGLGSVLNPGRKRLTSVQGKVPPVFPIELLENIGSFIKPTPKYKHKSNMSLKRVRKLK